MGGPNEVTLNTVLNLSCDRSRDVEVARISMNNNFAASLLKHVLVVGRGSAQDPPSDNLFVLPLKFSRPRKTKKKRGPSTRALTFTWSKRIKKLRPKSRFLEEAPKAAFRTIHFPKTQYHTILPKLAEERHPPHGRARLAVAKRATVPDAHPKGPRASPYSSDCAKAPTLEFLAPHAAARRL
eukprot:1314205-Pyramimonas_sp.AAC.1